MESGVKDYYCNEDQSKIAIVSIAISLKRIADDLNRVVGHIYGDPEKGSFIRTSDIED